MATDAAKTLANLRQVRDDLLAGRVQKHTMADGTVLEFHDLEKLDAMISRYERKVSTETRGGSLRRAAIGGGM